jgi:protocadherin delta 1
MNAMEINFRSAGWPSRGTALLLLLVMLQAMAMLAQRSAAQELWYSVTEQQAAGTVVGNLRTNLSAITKYDVSSSSNVNFHSIAQNSAPLFSINASSGIIQTTKVIDRDLVCPGQATCNVKYDVIVSPLPIVHTVMLKVFIAIIDINDNAPMFPERRVSFQIPESTPVGASFVIRGAYDADGPTFNVQRYALINDQGKFALVAPFTSSSDVKLVLTSALDAESADAYRMTLAAYDCEDQGDDDVIASPAALCHADSIAIDVTVVDVNDNIPVFDETSYTARIREDARLGTSVLRIRAVDNDQGRNALVSYRISSTPAPDASRTFYINNETHADGNAVDVILSSPLSYVDAPVHTFTVTACDFGVPRLCNDAKVTVTVVPVNRRTLVITVNTVSAADVDKMTLREDAAVGAFVAQVCYIIGVMYSIWSTIRG